MIVIAEKPGQLGNMLMLFSHFIARASESNLTVSNIAFDDYAHFFPTTSQDFFSRFPARRSALSDRRFLRRYLYDAVNFTVRLLGKLGGRLPFVRVFTIYDWDSELPLGGPEFLKEARRKKLVFVRGWGFRDRGYVEKHSETIRQFFRIPEQNERNIDRLIAEARRDADVLIGVHIRQGLISFDNTRCHFYFSTEYAARMEELIALFPGRRVAFLICSDFPQDSDTFAQFRVTFGTGSLIEDLYALARCDYILGVPSTFTMWASFYGKVPINFIRHRSQRLDLADFVTMEDKL